MSILKTAAAASSNDFDSEGRQPETLTAPDFIDEQAGSDDFGEFGDADYAVGPSSVTMPAVPAPTMTMPTMTMPAMTMPAMPMPGKAGQKATMADVYLSLKNAVRLKWNQGENIGISGANFLTKSKPSTSLGDFLVIELLSWYPHFVVSPKQSGAPKELVKYSDDGIYTKDGTLITEWIQNLKRQKFHAARCEERLMLVGTLVACDKGSKDPKAQKLVGTPVMVDLPPSSVSNWDKFRIATGIALRDKKFDPELIDMSVLYLTAEAVSNTLKTGQSVNYGKCEMNLYDADNKTALKF